MKKNRIESMTKKLMSGLISLSFVLGSFAVAGDTVSAAMLPVSTGSEFRGCWVSTVYNLDFPSKKGLSNDAMKKEIDTIIDGSAALGLNAIMLQVRPSADALYQSDIFPWSEYLTGTQGKAPADGFDPLKYWVEQSHKKGLELHAWINPYRITSPNSKITDPKNLSEKHPARLNPSIALLHKGALYFDPGRPESRKLIIDGVTEIINKYDVDGIHIDDYFYPGADFADDASYKQYGGGLSKDDWRRENVNLLIQELQKTIKAKNPELRFGASPFGIWQNASSSPLGSDTRGNESFKSMYADSRKWVKEQWLDYICPQIYWNIGFDIADYQKLVNWWSDVCKDTGVDLYIGHAAYKEVENAGIWQGEIVRQLKLNDGMSAVTGSVFFRYSYLTGGLGKQIEEYYTNKKRVPAIIMDKLSITQPSKDISLSAKGYNVMGTCDPSKPLLLNGKPVSVTPEGFFNTYVGLVKGKNVLTFTQEKQETVVRTITVTDPEPPKGTTAPATPPLIEVKKGTPTYATVTEDSAWLYPGASVNGGSSWALLKGQKDTVVATQGDWVKLACNKWVELKNVSIKTESKLITGVLTGGVYQAGENVDILKWKASQHPATDVSFDGKSLTIFFGLQDSLPGLDLRAENVAQRTMFKSMSSGISGTAPYYTFTLKDGQRIEGFYTDYSDGEFRLHIKKPRKISDGEKPLEGFKFVVDAGHGDTDNGALGPMGTALSEKHINLANALKLTERLKNLGASVTMVRDTDVFYTLQQRVDISRAANPDMFISMHANSMDYTTDTTNIRGFSVWYRNETSKALSDTLISKLYRINPITTRRAVSNQSNFFVCRPSWAPSVIIEASFLCNADDFAWLIDEEKQNEMADGVVKAILSYYGG